MWTIRQLLVLKLALMDLSAVDKTNNRTIFNIGTDAAYSCGRTLDKLNSNYLDSLEKVRKQINDDIVRLNEDHAEQSKKIEEIKDEKEKKKASEAAAKKLNDATKVLNDEYEAVLDQVADPEPTQFFRKFYKEDIKDTGACGITPQIWSTISPLILDGPRPK